MKVSIGLVNSTSVKMAACAFPYWLMLGKYCHPDDIRETHDEFAWFCTIYA